MTTILLFAYLYANPWYTMALVTFVLYVLHVPYLVQVNYDKRGREHVVYQSAMYRYEYGPGYARFEYDGLRRLQFWLLALLSLAATQIQPALVAQLAELLRQALGL